MPNNWKTYKLDDVLISRNQGVNTTTEKVKYSKTGIKVIRAKNIFDYKLDFSDTTYVDNKTFSRIRLQCKPKFGDVLYSNIGSQMGSALKVNIADEFMIAWNVLRIVPKISLLDSTFLCYLLNEKSNKEYIRNLNSSSTMPFVSGKILGSLEFNLPPLPEQKAIASILSAIDDKIENNLAINKTLEDMAMALYKHWFVDFGPFQDGEFIDSELGPIPKGWEVKRLPEISINHNRKRKPISTRERAKIQGEYPYYGATKILDYINDFKFDGDFILVAEDGRVKTERDTPFLQFVNGQFWVSNHAHVLTGNESYSNEFLYLSLSNTNVIPIITGAVQLKINKQNLESLEFIAPPIQLLKEFENLIIPNYKQIKELEKENQALTQLRDTILPKLISGEIRLKEFQEQIETVL